MPCKSYKRVNTAINASTAGRFNRSPEQEIGRIIEAEQRVVVLHVVTRKQIIHLIQLSTYDNTHCYK